MAHPGGADPGAAAAIKEQFRRRGLDPDTAIDADALAALLCGLCPRTSRGEVEALLAHMQKDTPGGLCFSKAVDFLLTSHPESKDSKKGDEESPGQTREEDTPLISKVKRVVRNLGLSTEDEQALTEDDLAEALRSVRQSPSKSCGVVQRPQGMADPAHDEVTETMRQRQREDPTKWALTFEHWQHVITHCTEQQAYKELQKSKRFVNMYEINDIFVKPWTRGTGCGAAVLMSQDENRRSAQLMLSHAWAEDVEECLKAVASFIEEHKWPNKESIMVWFCVFANYQPEDRVGPSIQEQLKLEPFRKVIESPHVTTAEGGFGMLAIHTTKEDLYTRLWCVHEVERAVHMGLSVEAAMSSEYEKNVRRRVDLMISSTADAKQCLDAAGTAVSTIRAQCNPNDEKMLIEEIMKSGGFDELDKVIADFRRGKLPDKVIVDLIFKKGLTPAEAGKRACDKIQVFAAFVLEGKIPLNPIPEHLDADDLLSLFKNFLARPSPKSSMGNLSEPAAHVALQTPVHIAVMAARALGELAQSRPGLVAQQVAEVLVDSLVDERPNVREAVLRACCELDKNAMSTADLAPQRLAKFLDAREEAAVRCMAATALGQLDRSLVQPYARQLANLSEDQDPSCAQIRAAATTTLWFLEMKELTLVAFVQEVLNKESGSEMQHAVPKHLVSELVQDLTGAKAASITAAALGKLVRLGPERVSDVAAKALADRFGGEDRDALAVFSKLGERVSKAAEVAAPRLARMLEKSDVPSLLCDAAAALRQLGHEFVRRYADILVSLASESASEKVRDAAVEALSKLDMPDCTLDVAVVTLLSRVRVAKHDDLGYEEHSKLLSDLAQLERREWEHSEAGDLAWAILRLEVAIDAKSCTDQTRVRSPMPEASEESRLAQKWLDCLGRSSDTTKARAHRALMKFRERTYQEMYGFPDLPSSVVERLRNPHAELRDREQCELIRSAVLAGLSEAGKAGGRQLLMLLGNTGAGKSTFANFLLGRGMVSKELDDGSTVYEVAEGSPVKINHTNSSETFCPQVEDLGRNGLFLCDCPGFFDNRSVEIRIANAANIKAVAAAAASARIVVLVNYHSLHTDRSRSIQEILDLLAHFFGDPQSFQSFAGSVMLGISRCPLALDGKNISIDHVREMLKKSETCLDDVGAQTLRNLSSNLFIFHPLDNGGTTWQTREQILNSIERLRPISEPGKSVCTIITPDCEKALRNILDDLQERIKRSMERDNDFDHLAKEADCMWQLMTLDTEFVKGLVNNAVREVDRSLRDHYRQGMTYLRVGHHVGAKCSLQRFVRAAKALAEALGRLGDRSDMDKELEQARIELKRMEDLEEPRKAVEGTGKQKQFKQKLFKENPDGAEHMASSAPGQAPDPDIGKESAIDWRERFKSVAAAAAGEARARQPQERPKPEDIRQTGNGKPIEKVLPSMHPSTKDRTSWLPLKRK